MQRQTDVLIVGGGGSGLAASMLLSSQGVQSLLVSKYAQTSRLPKASGLAIKTMEIFREVGVEEAVRQAATPPEYLPYTGFYAGLAGDGPDYGRPIARLGYWDRGGTDVDWLSVSSVRPANLMQSELEPLMKARAEELAPGSIAFHHEFISFTETPDGVLATIRDRATGHEYQIAARYLLACDGGRAVGPQLGVEMEGHLAVATTISVHFTADLSPWYRDSEALLTTVMNPDIGVPCALVAMGPHQWGAHSTDWVVHLLSFVGEHKVADDEAAIAMTRRCLGLPDLKMDVHVINRWPLDAVVASRFRVGRAFVLGDAAHRMPPAGGHGLNTAIQDAYNLCWKLAAVLQGRAGEALLDTYERERRPLAQYVVKTALAGYQGNKEVALAIGLHPDNGRDANWAKLRAIWCEGPDGEAARRRLASALPWVTANANPLNLAFGYSYHDGAVINDGPVEPRFPDPRGVYEPSTRPGHTVPDRWIDSLSGQTALGDLVGRGRFVLIAGEAGRAWTEAAQQVARERGIALDAFTIGGTEGDWLDPRRAWARVRGFGPEGAILVRPDRFIAWRAMDAASDAVARLNEVFDTLLGSAHSSKLGHERRPVLAGRTAAPVS